MPGSVISDYMTVRLSILVALAVFLILPLIRTICLAMGAETHIALRRRPLQGDHVRSFPLILRRCAVHKMCICRWGESAGSVSVIDQILTNDGENDGLFRGAVMESGFSQPTSDITAGQPIYDHLVASTNCTTASSTLECLRAAPYNALMRAVDSTPSIFSYSSLDLTWPPRVDGIFLKRTPRESLEAGQYAQVSETPTDVPSCEPNLSS